ncbi:MAG: hypothetical protein KAQ68_02280 [Clostridiales bacterium]|nr:hypothetical protein [Clostridiales bacterium]
MKKIVIVIIILMLIVSTTACSAKQIKAVDVKVEELNSQIEDLNDEIENLADAIDEMKIEIMATPTPEPTPEPTPLLPSPNEIIEIIFGMFKSESLPIETIEYFDETTDPNEIMGRPERYVAKAQFDDPRSDDEPAVTIEIFKNKEDMVNREIYLSEVYDSYPSYQMYMYTRGLSLLRISFDLTPQEALEYETLFNEYWDN